MIQDLEEKVRVLIVDDIPETHKTLSKLLSLEKDIEVIGSALSGQESIKMAKELRPDIVLMDVRMPGMNGIVASEAIIEQVPSSKIIMMSVEGEIDYFRRSMLAGAREFLVKPFGRKELVTSIRQVHALGTGRRAIPEQKGGKIIALFSPKGGTGCSTIATNLAIAIKEETKERVALVDGSLQFGDIGVLLNLKTRENITDLVPRIAELDEELLDEVMSAHSSGIKVLLAPPSPEMAELVTPEHMKRVLTELREVFDYIIVDTWAFFHDLVLTILELADQIVLLITSEIPAIKNTKFFFEITEALGYPPEKTVLVLNKVNRKSGISIGDIEASIKYPIATYITLDERTTGLAENQGVPFVISYKDKPISQNLFALARLLVQGTMEERPSQEQVVKFTRRGGNWLFVGIAGVLAVLLMLGTLGILLVIILGG